MASCSSFGLNNACPPQNFSSHTRSPGAWLNWLVRFSIPNTHSANTCNYYAFHSCLRIFHAGCGLFLCLTGACRGINRVRSQFRTTTTPVTHSAKRNWALTLLIPKGALSCSSKIHFVFINFFIVSWASPDSLCHSLRR